MTNDARDDREDFERERRGYIESMLNDARIQEDARRLKIESDRMGWPYVWDWLGMPIIQTPSDVMVIQEIVWETRPEVIVETGVARGGSVILYSSLLELLGRGTVIGIDIDIRPHNREALESHPLYGRVELIEGSSTDPATVEQVRELIGDRKRVMVVLDSNHTHSHVATELEMYSPLVGIGCYLIVADTIVEHIPPQEHRPRPWGPGDNPQTALDEFLGRTRMFEPDRTRSAKALLTDSPGGFLRRVG